METATLSGETTLAISTSNGLVRSSTAFSARHDGKLPEHLHPLRILDFDPLPPQMPLIAGIIQAWQPLAEKYDELSRGPVECDDEGATLRDRWDRLFRVATVGWSPVPLAKGLLEHVLDRQEQVSEWQRLGQSWHEFVTEVIACGRCVKDPHKLRGEPVFVIMIDDVDLQVERIRELLPALRFALSSQCRISSRRSLGTSGRHPET